MCPFPEAHLGVVVSAAERGAVRLVGHLLYPIGVDVGACSDLITGSGVGKIDGARCCPGPCAVCRRAKCRATTGRTPRSVLPRSRHPRVRHRRRVDSVHAWIARRPSGSAGTGPASGSACPRLERAPGRGRSASWPGCRTCRRVVAATLMVVGVVVALIDLVSHRRHHLTGPPRTRPVLRGWRSSRPSAGSKACANDRRRSDCLLTRALRAVADWWTKASTGPNPSLPSPRTPLLTARGERCTERLRERPDRAERLDRHARANGKPRFDLMPLFP